MIVERLFYRIRVNIRDVKRVFEANNTFKELTFIEAKPAGIFSGSADIVYENPLLDRVLKVRDIPFRKKSMVSCICVITEGDKVEFNPKKDLIDTLVMNVEKLAERLTIVEKNMNKEVNMDEIKKKIFEEMVSIVDSSTLEYPENKK